MERDCGKDELFRRHFCASLKGTWVFSICHISHVSADK